MPTASAIPESDAGAEKSFPVAHDAWSSSTIGQMLTKNPCLAAQSSCVCRKLKGNIGDEGRPELAVMQ
jgi:hypothetical protein